MANPELQHQLRREKNVEEKPVAPVKKTVLELKLEMIEAEMLFIPPDKRNAFAVEIAAIKEEQKKLDEHPPQSFLGKLLKMAQQMLDADRIENQLQQITLKMNRPKKSPWEEVVENTQKLADKAVGDKKDGVEKVAEQRYRAIKAVESQKIEEKEVRRNDEQLRIMIRETVGTGEKVVRGEIKQVDLEINQGESKSPEEQRTEIFEESLRKALETKGITTQAEIFLEDLNDIAKRQKAKDLISRDEQSLLYNAGVKLIEGLDEKDRSSYHHQLERLMQDLGETNKLRVLEDREKWGEVEKASGFGNGKSMYEMLVKPETADEINRLSRQYMDAESSEERKRIGNAIQDRIDDPSKVSEIMRLLESANVDNIEALDQWQANNLTEHMQSEGLGRGVDKKDRYSQERRDQNLLMQGFGLEEIAEMKRDPEKYLRSLLDMAHGETTTSKSPDRNAYFHKLQVAVMEISTYYKLGNTRPDTVFGSQELTIPQREAYWKRILEMYRCRFGLTTAQNQIGIESDIEKRTGILAYFGTRETGWFYKQWWYKMADLEVKQHGDELNDLLNMGERFPEVERYLRNAQRRSNRWLETWIRDFEKGGDTELGKLAENNLANLFGREMTKDGILLDTLLKNDRSLFLRQVKHIVDWGDGVDPDPSKFGVALQAMHTSYDFMRWDMSLSEADARFIHRDEHGHLDGFMYDPQAPAEWRVLLANEHGGEAWVKKLIEIEKNPKRKDAIVAKWEEVRKLSSKDMKHRTLLAETHWQKTKKAYRRGEYGAGPRSLMNFFDGNERLGRENLEIAKLFDKLNSFRSIPTSFYLQSIKDGHINADWLIDAPRDIEAIRSRAIDKHDGSYMRSLSADYGKYKRDYNPGSVDDFDYGGVDIEAAMNDPEIRRAQAQALAATRLFEEFADRKSTTIRDHHLKGMGLTEMKHIIAEMLENPQKALAPGGVLSKLDRKTLISEIFEFPNGLWEGEKTKNPDGSETYVKGEKDFWLNDVAERMGCGLLAPDKNKQMHLLLMKQLYAGSPSSYKAQRNLFYTTMAPGYLNVPYTYNILDPRRVREQFKNWLSFKRAEWYVLGPAKIFLSGSGDFLGILSAYFEQFVKEATKGTDAEGLTKK